MTASTHGPSPAEPGERAADPSRRRRRRGLVAALGIVGVVLVAGAAAVAGGLVPVPGRTVEPPAPEVVVLPSPTPTIAPVARTPTSAFADALPATVLDHALVAVEEETALLVAGALESYRLSYSDGADGVVTVVASQWDTPEAAAAQGAAVTAGAVPPADGAPASGDVMVDGAVVGTWVLTQAPESAENTQTTEGTDGTATVTWTNGTALLQATAPAEIVRDVYAAYPL